MRFKGSFNFVHSSKYFFIFSIVVTILGAATLGLFGLNYGIDFSSGTNIDISIKQQITKDQVNQVLSKLELSKTPNITEGSERMSIRFSDVLTEDMSNQFQADFKAISPESTFDINTVDAEIARELQLNAILSVLIASLGIIIYVSFRFNWRFAVSAVISLLHVAFLVISVFSIFRLEVNLPFILAILTIIGYAIHDTIVIFDRIRENMRFAKIRNLEELAQVVNESIYQTLARSINTVLTVLFAAGCLFVFGSESIRMFSLAIIIGLVFGCYSSIFIASPLWVLFKKNQIEPGNQSKNPKKPQQI